MNVDADNLVQDRANDRAYFSMLPNLLDDLLDPYQYRLYAHLKRVCGERGTCWQSTATMAELCRMSAGKISAVKRELAEMGLIEIEEKPRTNGGSSHHHITIIDIWQRNIEHCSTPRSPGERAGSPGEAAASQDERAGSPGETKKIPSNKIPSNENPDLHGADAPDPGPESNPAQERLTEMRERLGADPFTVAASTEKAQAQVGGRIWTVPVEAGGTDDAGARMAAAWWASKRVEPDTVPKKLQTRYLRALARLAGELPGLSPGQAADAIAIVLDPDNPEFNYYTYSDPSVVKFEQDWTEVALRLLNGGTGYLTTQHVPAGVGQSDYSDLVNE